MNSLLDLLKYFAKYPDKAAVLENFARVKSAGSIVGYSDLKAAIEALPDVSVMPNIKSFVFSSDEQKVDDKLRSIEGYFMLLEYGPISISPPNTSRTRDREWSLAVTFGFPQDSSGNDLMSEALIMDQLYKYAFQLQSQLEADNITLELCEATRFAESSINILAVEPALLYQNYGVVVSFTKNIMPE